MPFVFRTISLQAVTFVSVFYHFQSFLLSTVILKIPIDSVLHISATMTSAEGLPQRSEGIPPHDGHPCLRLYPSHYRANSGLSPVRMCVRRAHHMYRQSFFRLLRRYSCHNGRRALEIADVILQY